MTPTVEKILSEAIGLEPAERMEFVEALISTFRGEDEPLLDLSRLDEITRRSEEIASGQVRPIP